MWTLSSNNAGAVYSILEGSTMYTQHMLDLYALYDWHAVLQYHFAFHLRRRREMRSGVYSGWAGVDEDFRSKYLHGHERSRVMKQRGSSSLSSQSGSSSHASTSRNASQVCFNFNNGACNQSPCPQGRIHKCRNCGSVDHALHSGKCSKVPA